MVMRFQSPLVYKLVIFRKSMHNQLLWMKNRMDPDQLASSELLKPADLDLHCF